MLATPPGLVCLIICYAGSKAIFHRKDPGTNSHNLLKKCEIMAVGMFMVSSPWDLTSNHQSVPRMQVSSTIYSMLCTLNFGWNLRVWNLRVFV